MPLRRLRHSVASCCLDLEHDRPRPLERAGDGGADLARLAAAEELGRIGDADEAGAGHLEDADLVRRAEAVLGRAQDAVRAVAVALELEHAVDEVLEHARAGDRAVLRHVADEEDGDAVLLRDAQQASGGLAHLGDRAGRRAELGRVERLHRVDHADVGPLALERRADRLELGLGEDLDAPRSRRAGRRAASPARRLLAGDEQRAALRARDRAQRHQQQRRLADARLAADEDERGGNEPAAEHAVELGDAGRDALGLLGLDVDQAQERLRGRGGRAARVNFDSSTSVPNSPQPGQRPNQRPDEYPHSGQEKTDARSLGHGASLRSGPDAPLCRVLRRRRFRLSDSSPPVEDSPSEEVSRSRRR